MTLLNSGVPNIEDSRSPLPAEEENSLKGGKRREFERSPSLESAMIASLLLFFFKKNEICIFEDIMRTDQKSTVYNIRKNDNK